MSGVQRLCLVIPCYNEAQRLPVTQIESWIASSSYARVLLVDDGSHDGTLDVLRQIQRAREEAVSIRSLPANRGKAEAVRLGILDAMDKFSPEIVGFWDADLATPLDTVDRFLNVLDSRPDITMIFGSRVKLLGRSIDRRPARHYLGRVFATVVSNVLRLPIYDTQCGAKLFRATAETRKVFAKPFLSKWVFDVEIIARFLALENHDPRRLEKLIYEYPLEDWQDVAGSKVRPADFLRAFWDVYRIRRRYLP